MRVFLSILLIITSFFGSSQTVLKGNITDAKSGTAIPFARLLFIQNRYVAISNLEGQFSIPRPSETDTLSVTCVGYEPFSIIIKPQLTPDSIGIALSPNTMLREIEVFAKRKNPAFRILKTIRENEKYNNPDQLKAYEYEVYNTVQFDLANLSPRFYDNPVFGDLDFVIEYMDTVDGKPILPAVFTESVSQYYYHKLPEQHKEVISATRVTGLKTFAWKGIPDKCTRISMYTIILLMFLTPTL